jgi:hypothetical protein
MKKKRKPKSKRLALFSENEREYLHGRGDFDTVGKSQFHKKLTERFEALLDDLDLLQNSKKLKLWRSVMEPKYNMRFKASNYFEELFSDIEYDYRSRFHVISKGKSNKKIRYFWLDHNPWKTYKMDGRIFNEMNLFQALKKELTDSERELFLRGYHSSIFPTGPKDAISIEEIKKRL